MKRRTVFTVACVLLASAAWAQQSVVKVPLHSTGAASRLTALLLGQILPVFSLVAPCQPGASPVSVRRGTFTTDCQPTARPRIDQTVFELPDGRRMPYAIAVPRDLDPTEPRPLVLALHPGGRAPYYGSRFMWQVVEPALRDWRAIIVAPDVPARRWDNDESETAVLSLLESVLTTHAIDRTRILVTGYSMGGMGTWYLATRHADLFTGAIPMAASRRDNPLDGLGTMPIHVIHSPQDEVVPFGPAAETVEQLRRQGHPVALIEVDGAGHSDMGAYVEPLERAGEWMMERWSR